MKRRSFLKGMGLAFGALTFNFAFPWAAGAASAIVVYNGLSYRTEGGGRIGVSSDNGLTWSLHSDLGVNVTRLSVTRRNQLRATMKFAGRRFGLVLAPDQQRWMTA